MGLSPQIEELRRRVDGGPAPVAFAHFAGEYRRGGDDDEAVRVSRTGLARFPEASIAGRQRVGA